jgi:hypothetical protein
MGEAAGIQKKPVSSCYKQQEPDGPEDQYVETEDRFILHSTPATIKGHPLERVPSVHGRPLMEGS